MFNKPNKLTKTQETAIRLTETVRVYETQSDPEIWSSFDRGDEKAFNYLFRTYTPLMYRFGCQLTKDTDLVKDCIQNLFIRLRNKRGNLEQVNKIKSYLFKSIQREITSQLKTKATCELDEAEAFFPIEVSVETKLIHGESEMLEKSALEKALNLLSARQRQAILLMYKDGLSYKEVAELMDLKDPKYARKLVYRALEFLRDQIKPIRS